MPIPEAVFEDPVLEGQAEVMVAEVFCHALAAGAEEMS